MVNYDDDDDDDDADADADDDCCVVAFLIFDYDVKLVEHLFL